MPHLTSLQSTTLWSPTQRRRITQSVRRRRDTHDMLCLHHLTECTRLRLRKSRFGWLRLRKSRFIQIHPKSPNLGRFRSNFVRISFSFPLFRIRALFVYFPLFCSQSERFWSESAPPSAPITPKLLQRVPKLPFSFPLFAPSGFVQSERFPS